METVERPSSAGIALKYGLFTALVAILYDFIIYVLEQSHNPWLFVFSVSILILGIVVGINEYKHQNEGYVSYGEGLGVGSLLCAVAGFMYGVFTYLYLTFINVSYLKEAVDSQRSELERRGMADQVIDKQMMILEKFFTPSSIFMLCLLGTIIFGFIFSLIIAAVVKKDRNELTI